MHSVVTVSQADEIAFDNFAELHEFLMSAFAYMDDRIDPPSSIHRLNAESLREKSHTESLILAFKDQQLIGCAFARPENVSCYLGKLAVRADCRGAGVGQKLIEKAQHIARKHGCGTLELETRVELAENHRFFERLGFVKTRENAHEGYNRPTSYVFCRQIN